jgi:hypothetical protein
LSSVFIRVHPWLNVFCALRAAAYTR